MSTISSPQLPNRRAIRSNNPNSAPPALIVSRRPRVVGYPPPAIRRLSSQMKRPIRLQVVTRSTFRPAISVARTSRRGLNSTRWRGTSQATQLSPNRWRPRLEVFGVAMISRPPGFSQLRQVASISTGLGTCSITWIIVTRSTDPGAIRPWSGTVFCTWIQCRDHASPAARASGSIPSTCQPRLRIKAR